MICCFTGHRPQKLRGQISRVMAGLEKEDISLITGEEQNYVLKFRSLELWESLRQWLKKH